MKDNQRSTQPGFTRWSKAREEGWIPYRHRLRFAPPQLASDPDVEEEGRDPSLPIEACRQRVSLDSVENTVASMKPQDVFHAAVNQVLAPLPSHPLQEELMAIEELLETKLFDRPTACLPPERAEAESKFFPMRPTVNRDTLGPRAFYAMVYRFLRPRHDKPDEGVRMPLIVAHEAMHHVLHIAQIVDGDLRSVQYFEDLSAAYKASVASKGRKDPALMFDEITEVEAEVGAARLLAYAGRRQWSARGADELTHRYREWLPSECLTEFVDLVLQSRETYSWPPIDTLDENVSSRIATPLKRVSLSAESLSKIDRVAKEIASSADQFPLAPITRAVENLFLDAKPRYNVIIRCQPHPTSEVYAVVERQDLHSVFKDVNDKFRPHLIRYTIRYPDAWVDSDDPEARIAVYQWLALISLMEWHRPPEFTVLPTQLTARAYSPEVLTRAAWYACTIDAIVGRPLERRPHGVAELSAMLRDSCVQIDEIQDLQRVARTSAPHDDVHVSPTAMGSAPLQLTGYVESVQAPHTVTVVARTSPRGFASRLQMSYELFDAKRLGYEGMRFRYRLIRNEEGNLESRLEPIVES